MLLRIMCAPHGNAGHFILCLTGIAQVATVCCRFWCHYGIAAHAHAMTILSRTRLHLHAIALWGRRRLVSWWLLI